MSDERQWREVHGVRSESMAEVHRRIAEDEASRPSSTPPARDSGRDEAREAVARTLIEGLVTYAESFASCWENCPDIDWREAASLFVNDCEVPEQLLSLPEVAAILTAPHQPPHSSR